MPVQELPEEYLRPIDSPSNSSLSSNSSDVILINAHYVRDSRSASVSSSTTNTQDDDSFEANINLSAQNNRNRTRNEMMNDDEEATYQPIKLPTEPTLEELLRQVTGGGDLQAIHQIKLRIISSAISLHRLPYFMPHLRVLNLEASMLLSLRDLGTDLSTLVYLNISRCGLKSLDGTNGLSNLTELVVDFNLIEDAGPCSNLPQIRNISLISNKIKDFHGMMFLGLCNQLKVLDMTNNDVARKENYRETVRQNIPNLMFLDKIPFEEVNEQTKRELLRSEYQPENNGVVRRNLPQTVRVVTSVISEWSRLQTSEVARPTTAAPPVTHISIGKRPLTADGAKPKYDVSVGEPVCGNIITKARKPRKLKTAWGDSCSSSSFSSSDSSTQVTPKKASPGLATENESCEELLESARLWREKSKEARDRFNK